MVLSSRRPWGVSLAGSWVTSGLSVLVIVRAVSLAALGACRG